MKKIQEKFQKKVIEKVKKGESGRLLLSPRVGKTKIGLSLIKRDKPNSILWVTPFTSLKKDIESEFIKWNAKNYLKKTKIITYASLHKEIGYYDYIILDEEQYITRRNVKPLIDKNLTYSILLTMSGTETKDLEKIYILKNQLKLKILKKLEIQEAVDLNILSQYQILNVLVELENRVDFKTKSYSEKTWNKILNNQIKDTILKKDFKNLKFFSLKRMRFLAQTKSKEDAIFSFLNLVKDKKTLIFATSIKQAEKFSKNTFHSKTNDKSLKLFIQDKIKHLSMVNSGGVGFTYKNIEYLVITQTNSNKNGLITQKIARTLLKQKNYKAKIVIFTTIGTQEEVWTKKSLKDFKNIKTILNQNLKDYVI